MYPSINENERNKKKIMLKRISNIILILI